MLREISEILSNAVLVTGLVTVMMMLIECFNVWSKGRLTHSVRQSGPLQVILCALLGAVPGCMGGFAVVSMYTHGMVSFGALIAMMIASSGDEAFVMLAMVPRQALLLMAGLAVLAVVAGLVTDLFYKPAHKLSCCTDNYATHHEDFIKGKKHFGWKRILLLSGVCLFLAALCFGMLEEGHEGHAVCEGSSACEGSSVCENLTACDSPEMTIAPEPEFLLGGINLLSEDWMNVMFAIFGISVLVMTVLASDHFVDEHLWHHIVREHLPKIFLWTAGTLAVIAVLMHYIDISSWMGDNVFLMVLIAALVGIIPESGPHLIFVTLFASGIVPLPVLVASCISQDGHAALPLLAEDRPSFLRAKVLNFLIALLAGSLLLLFA